MLIHLISQKINSGGGRAVVLLLLLAGLPSQCTLAQSSRLPAPQPTVLSAPTTSSAPTPARQEIIPLAQPKDMGEIVVDEQGGGLISLKVRDASLKQVVAMIAETQRASIVFSTAEDVKVTGALVRVPWQKALETLLGSTGHTWTVDEGIIVITMLDGAETISPQAGGRRVETFELDFAKAVDVDQTVKGLLSPAGKSWVTESRSTDNRQAREVVAVVDYPANLRQIADYIGQVDQPPRQVLIKANILQVTLDDDCRSGVNLRQLVSFSGNQLALTTSGFAAFANASALSDAINNPLAGAPNGSFLTLDGGSLDGLIEALQTTTDAKSLASTELMTVSGQEARLQSGSQIGFLGGITTTQAGNDQQSVQFLDVGVVLAVTPNVTRDGRVLMRVKPEVSEGLVDPEVGIPTKDTVEVDTDVLLHSGQGLVIGGLIQELDNNIQNKIPWLGDIPYAGILFQRRQVVKSRTEIIVTLVPHVLPYTPIGQAHNNHRVMRAEQPLLAPPLVSANRPHDPKLPDTFNNPQPLFPGRYYRQHSHAAAAPVEMSPPTYETGLPANQQGPLCLPPEGSQPPTPTAQQALRHYPIYR